MIKAINLTSLLFFLIVSVSAQTADEILANYYENIGGIKAWKNLKSMKMSGKSNMQGMEFPITVYSKRPNYEKLEIEVQGMQIIQAFDGTIAWSINPFQGDTKPTKADEETSKEAAKKNFEDELIDYAAKGHTVELLEEQEIEGAGAFQLKLTKKDGGEQIYFFDKENYVPIMIKSFATHGPMKGQAVETYLSDYEEVEGMMIPMSLSQKVNGQVLMQGTMETVELNTEIDDSVFAFPGMSEEVPVPKAVAAEKEMMKEKQEMKEQTEMVKEGVDEGTELGSKADKKKKTDKKKSKKKKK